MYLTSLGFTAIVNKDLSAKYETLVNLAPDLIKTLPWGSDYEVDVFKKPDFTALEVLTFANGGKLYFEDLIYRPLPIFMMRHPIWYKRTYFNSLVVRLINMEWNSQIPVIYLLYSRSICITLICRIITIYGNL